jgi:hypothetical protein
LPKGESVGIQSRSAAILHSIEDFEMAIDRCVQAEKVLLKHLASIAKEKQPNVEVTSLCLAHVLVNTHDSFAYPEEWNYVVYNTIKSNFDNAALAMAGKGDKETREWLIVYRPMIKYLIASFRHLLQCRVAHLSEEVMEILPYRTLCGNSDSSGKSSEPLNVAMELACFVGDELNCDYVLSSITEVDTYRWQNERDTRDKLTKLPAAAIVEAPDMSTNSNITIGSDVDEAVVRIRSLLDTYNNK